VERVDQRAQHIVPRNAISFDFRRRVRHRLLVASRDFTALTESLVNRKDMRANLAIQGLSTTAESTCKLADGRRASDPTN
jgi:hypothetical protein